MQAQSDDSGIPQMEELSKQMEQMMEQMQKMMGDMPIGMDTFFIEEFSSPMMPGEDWPVMPLDSLNSGSLFDLLQEQMQEIDAEDWAEIQRLFEQFGTEMPLMPAPKDWPKQDLKDKEGKKKKKKRKVYTL